MHLSCVEHPRVTRKGELCGETRVGSQLFSVVLSCVRKFALSHPSNPESRTPPQITQFVTEVDSSWANCPGTQRSWFGYCLRTDGGWLPRQPSSLTIALVSVQSPAVVLSPDSPSSVDRASAESASVLRQAHLKSCFFSWMNASRSLSVLQYRSHSYLVGK